MENDLLELAILSLSELLAKDGVSMWNWLERVVVILTRWM